MIQFLKTIFGISPKVNFGELIANGALIIDVRTKIEYGQGHLKGSENMPLDQLISSCEKIENKDQVIITCCASGSRSLSAQRILKEKGFKQVYNGGAWYSLREFKK